MIPIFRRWLRHKRIAFDTSFLIPLLEDEKEKENKITRLLRLLERKPLILITSTVTLLEVLVRPYQQRDMETVNRYYGYFNRTDLVTLFPVTNQIADRAAEIRALYGYKTPDAIQLATALETKCSLFLTQDHAFKKQKEIEIGVFK